MVVVQRPSATQSFWTFENPDGVLFIDLVATMVKIEKDNTMQPTVRVKARGYMDA